MATINSIFYLSLLVGCPRVLKLCMQPLQMCLDRERGPPLGREQILVQKGIGELPEQGINFC